MGYREEKIDRGAASISSTGNRLRKVHEKPMTLPASMPAIARRLTAGCPIFRPRSSEASFPAPREATAQ